MFHFQFEHGFCTFIFIPTYKNLYVIPEQTTDFSRVHHPCPSPLLLPRSDNLLVERQNVRHGPQRGDGERVDLGVRLGVVVLDVQEVGGVAESRQVPVQVAHPVVDGGIA